MTRAIGLTAFLLAAIHLAAQQQPFDGKSWWHHVEVLAGDDMEGRGTGTPGLERAEAYVVDQLKASGIPPAGSKGYYQPVSFETRTVMQSNSSAVLVRGGKAEPLLLGEDAALGTMSKPEPRLEAPLVFLGYGLRVPEKNYNDLADGNLNGKVAIIMTGEPEGFSVPNANDYLISSQRWQELRNAGLVGVIVIPAPLVPGVSGVIWSRVVGYTGGPNTDLVGDEFDDTRGGLLNMVFNPVHADKLFQGTGHTSAELLALRKDQKPLPHFDLPVRIRTAMRMVRTPFASANIVAKIEGSDPQLKNEYVVLSAHIDHVGIANKDVAQTQQQKADPGSGDNIYNGALDNASGCAALLEIARKLKQEGAHPKRSILFVFFTGEELGLLGSKYFTVHPPVAPKSIVADLNIDTIHALVPLTAVAVMGMEESDLGEAATRAAASQNITANGAGFPLWGTAPDLSPVAYGSDNASFVFRGIPAIRLTVDFPGEQSAVLQKWRRSLYHTPFDDVHQPVNLETAAKYEHVMMQLLLDVANNPLRPQWKPTSVYKRYAK